MKHVHLYKIYRIVYLIFVFTSFNYNITELKINTINLFFCLELVNLISLDMFYMLSIYGEPLDYIQSSSGTTNFIFNKLFVKCYLIGLFFLQFKLIQILIIIDDGFHLFMTIIYLMININCIKLKKIKIGYFNEFLHIYQ